MKDKMSKYYRSIIDENLKLIFITIISVMYILIYYFILLEYEAPFVIFYKIGIILITFFNATFAGVIIYFITTLLPQIRKRLKLQSYINNKLMLLKGNTYKHLTLLHEEAILQGADHQQINDPVHKWSKLLGYIKTDIIKTESLIKHKSWFHIFQSFYNSNHKLITDLINIGFLLEEETLSCITAIDNYYETFIIYDNDVESIINAQTLSCIQYGIVGIDDSLNKLKDVIKKYYN